jgi:hypothetical protein
MSEEHTESFIVPFTNYLRDKYKIISKEWAFKMSATTLASILNRNIWAKTKLGKCKLNLWNIVVSPTGVGKSIPIDEDIIPILIHVSEATENNFILPSIRSSFEGIVDRAREFGLRGIELKDEFTSMLKESDSGGYTYDTFETHSKLYDGWIFPRETRQVKIRKPIPVYVNLLGGTCPEYLYTLLRPTYFFQGVGNRVDYERMLPNDSVKIEKEDLFRDTTIEDLPAYYRQYRETGLDSEQQKFADILITRANKVQEKDSIVIVIPDEAQQASTDYYNKQRIRVKELANTRFEFKSGYIRRNWQKALKYACLLAFDQWDRWTTHNIEIIIINEQFITQGATIQEYNNKHFEKILVEWMAKVPKREQISVDDTGLLMSYLTVVKNFEIISQKRHALEIGISTRDTNYFERMSTLVSAGCVEAIIDAEAVKSVIQAKGVEWREFMLIGNYRGKPPALYKFIKDLPQEIAKK